MKLIVAGSRDITSQLIVSKAIDSIHINITELVSGTARGVDQLAEVYARAYGIPIKEFPAQWDLYGKPAGFLRNKDMAEYADAALVVWDGSSAGSRHMINIMNASMKPCFVYLVGVTYYDNKRTFKLPDGKIIDDDSTLVSMNPYIR